MLVPYRGRIRQRGGYPVFEGRAYQRGRGFGSVLSSMFRNFVVPAAKNIGKSLVQTGLQKTSGVLQSVADGRSLREAVSDQLDPADLGRNMLKTGLRKTSGILKNVADGRSLGDAFGQHFPSSVQRPRAQPRNPQRKLRMKQKTVPAKRAKKDIFG